MNKYYKVVERRGAGIEYVVFYGPFAYCERWMQNHTIPHPINKEVGILPEPEADQEGWDYIIRVDGD